MQPAGPSLRVPAAGCCGVPGTSGKHPTGDRSLIPPWKYSRGHEVQTGDPHATGMVPIPGAARAPSPGPPPPPKIPRARREGQPPPAPDLHPRVGGTQFDSQLCPRVDDSPDLCQGHEGQRQVRPRVEAHHLAVEETRVAGTAGHLWGPPQPCRVLWNRGQG